MICMICPLLFVPLLTDIYNPFSLVKAYGALHLLCATAVASICVTDK